MVFKSLALDSDGLIVDSGVSGFAICSGFQYAMFAGGSSYGVTEGVAQPQKGLSLEDKDQEKGCVGDEMDI